ncbi:RNA polymerase sigma factor FliA, partial [Klebsiella oxytoca]
LQIELAEYRQILLDTNNSQLFSYDEWHESYGESCEPSQDEDHDDNPLQMLLESDIRQRVIDAIELLPEREKM